jgi:hypothetical protein
MCLPHRCAATRAALTTEDTALLLLRAFASAGMYLPSRFLATNYSFFQASCHSMKEWKGTRETADEVNTKADEGNDKTSC